MLDGERKSFPDIAKHYHEAGQRWVAIGDENYGEGSSASTPRWSPGSATPSAVISRSFARIAETNLKKQGVLPLWFADGADYDRIGELDRISILGLADLAPDRPVACEIRRPDGTVVPFTCTHTLSDEQIEWFRAGGALNIIRRLQADARR